MATVGLDGHPRSRLAWLVTAVLLALLPRSASPIFVLEGSPTSYARFHKWHVGLNGTLDFEFKTEDPNGLLLYTDDGGTFDFFEVKLVEGALRLRFNLGGGASILTVGRNLHDNVWHKVSLVREYEETRLIVDREMQARVSRGSEFYFGNFSTNSFVYVGGLPSWYSSKLNFLALPSVIFEPRFRGAIRNLVYAHEDGPARRQEMIEYKGVRFHKLDVCEHQDPCQHNGICISTDNGAICDCRFIDFEGTFCEKEKAPTEATFRGNEFLSYDLAKVGGEPIVSSTDEVSLFFKTRQPSGLLFYTEDGQDFLNLALKDGGVVLTINLGSGALERQVKPSRVRFDDNQWHKVTVHRKVREISSGTSFCHFSMTVDGVYTERGTTAGTFSMLSSNSVFVGGSDNTEGLPGSRIRSNFVGCLRKVEFTADSLNLNLIELGRIGNKLINVHGNIQFMCQEVEAADPVTFTTKESFLVLPSWEGPRSGSISFKIRTNEPNGLLMYNSGATTAGGDFFAFEMMDGHVYLLLNLGSGAVKVKASNRRVDDGHWHLITLRRSARSARVTVDESASDFVTPGDSNQLDLEGALFVGGVGTSLDNIAIPVELWTGTLQYGYVGCMRDLVVNGNAIDIAASAKRQDSGSIRPACHTLPPQCDSQPCMNGGVCSEGWNRFICDCSASSFIGPTCGKDATTLSFDGEQHMKVTLPEESRTQAEDIVLRFRTTRPSGLLLITSTEKTTDRLELAVELGRAKLAIHLGEKEKVLHAGSGLNDNQWHTLRVSRRGKNIEFKIEDEPPILDEVPGKHITLEFRTMLIGALGSNPSPIHGSSPGRETPNFVGHMQQLVFNGIHLFEMARGGQMSNFEVTAKFGKKEHIVHHPVTFKTKDTFIGLSQLKAYSTMNLYFQFKTLEPNGLILYNVGKGQDFLAIELVNGHLNYLFNLGDRPWRVGSNTRNTLNDNRWHAVTIGRPTVRQHTLMVDDMIATVTSAGSNEHLDLDGILYLGGVPKAMYANLPKMIQSKHGFEGCLASLDLNGETPDPIVDALIPSTNVVPGCDGPSTKCSLNACSNRGVCIQQWNSYTCDCDMTSFTGPTCSDESTAYEFEPHFGLITFTYPTDRRPDTKGDLLALGFVTHKEKATLVRIDSSSSNDFMELGIIDGNILIIYNMGTGDHPIGEMGVKINDGQYHVVRFTRSGANSTFQLDDYNVQTKHPGGKQLNVFNSQSRIQVGGKRNAIKGTIEQPFEGIIAGLVFNGLRVLDMASERDPRITMHGDVTLLLSIPVPMGPSREILPTGSSGTPRTDIAFMQKTTASETEADDNIVSSGSGCGADDDEDCTTTVDTGSGDDLITPVYIPTTPKPRKPPTTTSRPKRPPDGSSKHCDDDEDCEPGSGSGELGVFPPTVTTDDMFFPSTAPSTSGVTTAAPETPTQPTLDRPTHGAVAPSQPPPWLPEPTKARTEPPTTPTTTLPSQIHRSSTIRTFNAEDYERKPRPGIGGPSGGNAESTALIIGIIAGILIAIVLIILLVYKCRNGAEGSYKIDESKNYQFATGMGMSGSSLMLDGQQPTMNGNVKMGEKANKLPKKKDLKDIKEWYV